MIWYQTYGACFNQYKALRKRQTSSGWSLNRWGYSTYMTSSRNPYEKAVTRSNCRILYPRFTLTSNRHLYDIDFTTATKISIKLIPSFCLKPEATYLALYFKIWPSWSFLSLKRHWPVITCRCSGIAVSSQVSFLKKESYSVCITSLHLGQSGRRIVWFILLGSSSLLLSKLDFMSLNVCTMWICDYAIWVLANCAKLEGISELAGLRLGWPGLSSNFLDIGAEL